MLTKGEGFIKTGTSVIFVLICLFAFDASATNPVLDWNSSFLDAARKNDTPSTLIARNFAVLHLAIAQAILTTDVVTNADRTEVAPDSKERLLTSAWAACETAVSLYPSQRVSFEKLRDSECAEFSDKENLDACRRRGQAIAHRILDERRADGTATNISYIPKTAPGEWRRTPPFYRPPELPQWGTTVKPLVLKRADQFRPAGPPAMASETYSDAVRETQSLGGKESTTRTTEQTLIARFWSDFSYTEMPVGHWNTIARDIAEARHLTPQEAARLFVLLNLALADTGVATWDAKYRYNAWRPVTAIPRAGEMNNPGLSLEKGWLPLLNTPAHPEYPSGHSAFSGAATSVLSHFFGTDAMSFDARSDTLADQHRHFESFNVCAGECGISRIYGGIHFRFSCEDGIRLGNQVGDYIWEQMQTAPLWADGPAVQPEAMLKKVSP